MQKKITCEGIEYTVTVSGGCLQFDPPLPEGLEGRKVYNFADMLISRRGPKLNTETAKLSGVGTLDKQFEDDPAYLKNLTDNVKRMGFTPKPTDIYLEQLVRPGYKLGDPEAFVPASDVSGHIKKVLKKRVDNDKRRDDALREQVLAPDVMQRLEKQWSDSDLNFSKLDANEKREAIISKHAHKD